MNDNNDPLNNKKITKLVSSVKFDTDFNQEDIDYSIIVSREYSDDVRMPEWVGL